MAKRYQTFAKVGVQNIKSFNERPKVKSVQQDLFEEFDSHSFSVKEVKNYWRKSFQLLFFSLEALTKKRILILRLGW